MNSMESSRSSSSDRSDEMKLEELPIGEELLNAISIAINRLMNESSSDVKEVEFPSSLEAHERAYVHRFCKMNGLNSTTKGKGSKKYLIASKKTTQSIIINDATLSLTSVQEQIVFNLLKSCPLTEKEKTELLPRIQSGENQLQEFYRLLGRLNLSNILQVPPLKGVAHVAKNDLAIHAHREEIIKTVSNNRVTIISGETSSGKTTQVPQYILEYFNSNNQSCRIICSFPNPLSAINTAQRVCMERNEVLGQTVGYHIESDSKISSKTTLTFCTNNALVKTLGDTTMLGSITHIILDDIHERNVSTDFLLILLKDILLKYKNLRLIMIGSPINTELLLKYFNHCPLIIIPVLLHHVQEYFLEDVLKLTNYQANKIKKIDGLEVLFTKPLQSETDGKMAELLNLTIDNTKPNIQNINELDEIIKKTCAESSIHSFNEIFKLICENKMSVDYQHSESMISPLMIACARGMMHVIERLLSFGANIHLKAANDFTALDWAKRFFKTEVIELLENYTNVSQQSMNELQLVKESNEYSFEEKNLIRNYLHGNLNDDKLDIDLLFSLLAHILKTTDEGSILVFLSDYDDVLEIKKQIVSSQAINNSKVKIFEITPSSTVLDSCTAVHQGFRKLILTAGVSESAITVNDVKYVINSARFNEVIHDPTANLSIIKNSYVSKMAINMRKNKAGLSNSGQCYHLISKIRFKNLQTSEALSYPLNDACLKAKFIAPKSTSITDFLSKAPESPQFSALRCAINHLKAVDTLDTWEDLTDLGLHLINLPVDLKYGKMILYSLALKCLDSILVIVSAMSCKDPFLKPSTPSERRRIALIKHEFAANTFSDHIAILRAYKAWEAAVKEGRESEFCSKNYLSSSILKHISLKMSQLIERLKSMRFVNEINFTEFNANAENPVLIKSALLAGLYPSLLRVDKTNRLFITEKETKVMIHCNSILSPLTFHNGYTMNDMIQSLPSDWIIYDSMVQNTHISLVNYCTLVSPACVAVFSGPIKLQQKYLKDLDRLNSAEINREISSLQLDSWINFNTDNVSSALILYLRQKFSLILTKVLKSNVSGYQMAPIDYDIIKTINEVLNI